MRARHAGSAMLVSQDRTCHRAGAEQMLASFAGAIQDIGRNRDWDYGENYVKDRYSTSLRNRLKFSYLMNRTSWRVCPRPNPGAKPRHGGDTASSTPGRVAQRVVLRP
jgi:hypothetical protein